MEMQMQLKDSWFHLTVRFWLKISMPNSLIVHTEISELAPLANKPSIDIFECSTSESL